MHSPLRAATLTAVLACAGCSGSTSGSDAVAREQSAKAFQQAEDALEQDDFARAKELFDLAIAEGHLSIDAIGVAYAGRAVCLAELGQFEEAHDDLDKMEQAPNQGEILAARSYVLEKQGKKAEARAAWAKAKRFNRLVQPY